MNCLEDHYAEALSENFCPECQAPLHVAWVWPPRVVIHEAKAIGSGGDRSELQTTFLIHHQLRDRPTLSLGEDGVATDAEGKELEASVEVSLTQGTAVPLEGGVEPASVGLTVAWGPEVRQALEAGTAWIAQPVRVVLKVGGQATRRFRWVVYLTPEGPQLPDPCYRRHWVNLGGVRVSPEGAAPAWLEVDPMASPACWVRDDAFVQVERHGLWPADLLCTAPVGDDVGGAELEPIGQDGRVGIGHRDGSGLLPLADQGDSVDLEVWTHRTAGGAGRKSVRWGATRLVDSGIGASVGVEWPEIARAKAGGGASDGAPSRYNVYRLDKPRGGPCDVLVTLRFDVRGTVRLHNAEIMVGQAVVGRWDGPPGGVVRQGEFSIRARIDVHAIPGKDTAEHKLHVAFVGRADAGVALHEAVFPVFPAPVLRLVEIQSEGMRPWIIVDLGTDSTCVALACMHGLRRRVIGVHFDDGPLLPSRVYSRLDAAKRWELTSARGEEATELDYTTEIKMGLFYGKGTHPGVHSNKSGLEVARFFLEDLLTQVKQRAAWYPLEKADVLFSFSPRLSSVPVFARSLQEAVRGALETVFGGHHEGRVLFREEAFLVAMPALVRDLDMGEQEPRAFYWVLDIGGGTSDLCGFYRTLPKNEDDGDFRISRFVYPGRLAGHFAGSHITGAFYQALRKRLADLGMVSGEGATQPPSRLFAIPKLAFPSAEERRYESVEVRNQNCLRELAELVKRVDEERQPGLTLGELKGPTMESRLLSGEKESYLTLAGLVREKELADIPIASLHEEVVGKPGSGAAGGTFGHRIEAFFEAVAKQIAGTSGATSDLEATPPDIVVLLAGRGSLFWPLKDRLKAQLDAHVGEGKYALEVLGQDWIQRHFGGLETIDTQADLKSLTVNGGGLFALDQSGEASEARMLVDINADYLDCPVFLAGDMSSERYFARGLDLRDQASASVPDNGRPEDCPPPISPKSRLLGNLRLSVEDPRAREWEDRRDPPSKAVYVSIADAKAERVSGRRPAGATAAMKIRTEGGGEKGSLRFVLEGLRPAGHSITFASKLVHLPLLECVSFRDEDEQVEAEE